MPTESAAEKPARGLLPRLSLMMFLQYAIWGAWLPILYPFLTGHLGFTKDECSYILAGGAAGAILGPFIAGQIADRHFATERFLGISHLVGAALVWMLATTADFWAFFVLSVVYGIVYAPTMALSNSLSFHHLPDRDRDFGRVRVWGTVGWIAAGIAVGHWLLHMHTPVGSDEAIKAAQNAGRADAFRVSAVLGLILGIYCFFLPHTPPTKGEQRSATREAFAEIRCQPLLTLFLIAIPISCIHQFYFVFTSDYLSQYGRDTTNAINKVLGVGGGGLMTIGQMSEFAVLAAIPLVVKKVSRKFLLSVGIAAYAARMALFAYTDSMATAILGVSLHGLCFGCFIFVAFIVVDEQTTADVRASAQNLFNLVIIGVGIIVGSWISLSVVGKWATEQRTDVDGKIVDVLNWPRLFSVPMWAALVCLVALLFFYPSKREPAGSRA